MVINFLIRVIIFINFFSFYYYFCHLKLKPQDSFGKFNNFFFDLQQVLEVIRKLHQTFLQLFLMTYCNAVLPGGKLSLCTLCKVFGETLNIFMFCLFPENGSISE